MFIKFFDALRAKGLRVTLGEWLTLQEALDSGLCGSSLTQFYYVARMILVKSETDFDKYDMAFEECFKGVKTEWGKISWPEKRQVIVETFAVIIIVTVFTIAIYCIDLIFKELLGLIK